MDNLYHDIYQLIPLLKQADYNATYLYFTYYKKPIVYRILA